VAESAERLPPAIATGQDSVAIWPGRTCPVGGGPRGAAGRDLVARLIATGEHARILVGDYLSFADAYISPAPVFRRVDVERFVGREWLVADIDRFLAEESRGYLIVEGEAGVGKTALVAHLVRTRKWVHHFSELAPGQDGVRMALQSLGAQLTLAYETTASQDQDALPSRAARPSMPRRS
jgi:hypothetical protein